MGSSHLPEDKEWISKKFAAINTIDDTKTRRLKF